MADALTPEEIAAIAAYRGPVTECEPGIGANYWIKFHKMSANTERAGFLEPYGDRVSVSLDHALKIVEGADG